MSPFATQQISPERLMQFTFGVAPPLMIETAIRYGVFDILDKRAMTLDALCAEIGASPRGLRTVLNALVGLDVLSKDAAGRYAVPGHRQVSLPWRIFSAHQRADAFILGAAP